MEARCHSIMTPGHTERRTSAEQRGCHSCCHCPSPAAGWGHIPCPTRCEGDGCEQPRRCFPFPARLQRGFTASLLPRWLTRPARNCRQPDCRDNKAYGQKPLSSLCGQGRSCTKSEFCIILYYFLFFSYQQPQPSRTWTRIASVLTLPAQPRAFPWHLHPKCAICSNLGASRAKALPVFSNIIASNCRAVCASGGATSQKPSQGFSKAPWRAWECCSQQQKWIPEQERIWESTALIFWCPHWTWESPNRSQNGDFYPHKDLRWPRVALGVHCKGKERDNKSTWAPPRALGLQICGGTSNEDWAAKIRVSPWNPAQGFFPVQLLLPQCDNKCTNTEIAPQLCLLEEKKHQSTAGFIWDAESGISVWNEGNTAPTRSQRCSQSSSPGRGMGGAGQGAAQDEPTHPELGFLERSRALCCPVPIKSPSESCKKSWRRSIFISLQGQVMRSAGHQKLAKSTFQT